MSKKILFRLNKMQYFMHSRLIVINQRLWVNIIEELCIGILKIIIENDEVRHDN